MSFHRGSGVTFWQISHWTTCLYEFVEMDKITLFVLAYCFALCCGDDSYLLECLKSKSCYSTSANKSLKVKNQCTTLSGVKARCVKRSNCADKDLEVLIDVRGFKQFAKDCENDFEVCCKNPTKIPTTTAYTELVDDKGCGKRKFIVGSRILSDDETQFGEIPWMVAILSVEFELSDIPVITSYLCGGSLIHPKVVLTAVHCVKSFESKKKPTLMARAGEWDSISSKEILPHQERSVAKIITHEDYYSGALYNDIALLILNEPFDEADNIGVVCLPKSDDDGLDKGCLASGWGKDQPGPSGKYNYRMKKVVLPMVNRTKCQDMLRKTRLGSYFELHPSFICAGGEKGKDTCKGDGGSPLVCPLDEGSDQFIQTGIVAWGIGCGEPDTPGVYTNVKTFRTWIQDRLKENDIDLTPYMY